MCISLQQIGNPMQSPSKSKAFGLEKDKWIKLRTMLNLPLSWETIFAWEVTAELLAGFATEWGVDTQLKS